MNKPEIKVIFLLLLCISVALIAIAEFTINQQYSLDTQGKLIDDYNKLLEENGIIGLNNLTYMINSGLVVSFNRPVQDNGLVRSGAHSYFLI